MIIVDRRETDIVSSFKPYGDVEIGVDHLDTGDFRWDGNGPNGTILIGVERKKLRDLIQSMRSRRLGGDQAPRLASECDVCYLIIEGIWRLGRSGAVEELRGRDWRSVSPGSKPILWREVDSFLSSMEEFYGFRIKQTQSTQESAAFIVSRYKYWTKDYSSHHMHRECYAPVPDQITGRKARFVSAEELIRRQYGESAVIVWRMAAQLPGIDIKADQVAAMFRTPKEMLLGTERDWRRAGLGPKTITKVIEALRGRED